MHAFIELRDFVCYFDRNMQYIINKFLVVWYSFNDDDDDYDKQNVIQHKA